MLMADKRTLRTLRLSKPVTRSMSRALLRCAPYALLVVACARELPSSAPLGLGPLAAKPGELDASTTFDVAPDASMDASVELAAAADAGTPAAEPETPAPPASAAATSEPVDAGSPSADAASEAPVVAVSGDYQGEDTAIVRVTGLPENVEKDPKARITVAETGKDAVSFTLVDSGAGTPICTLTAKRTGNSAVVAAGQSCFGSGPAAGRVERGTATFAQGRLVFDATVSLSVDLGEQQLRGTLEYHFEGKKR